MASKALPPNQKSGIKLGKRDNGSTKSVKASGKLDKQDASMGPRKSNRAGAPVSDGAGTRSTAGLPPKTEAMAGPPAKIPSAVKALAADTLPVPDANTDPGKLGMIVGWDAARDRKLGKMGNS